MTSTSVINKGISTDSSRLIFADALRGLASLWVVLYHMSEGKHLENLKPLIPESIYAAVFDAGHLGVGVFFVLSGFVMTLTVQQARVNRAYASRFMLRRLIRLTPPYYFAMLVSLAVMFLKSVGSNSISSSMPTFGEVLAHAVYIQGLLSIPHFNMVYWTLCIEVQFYIAFAIIFLAADGLDIRSGRMLIVGIASLMALCWPLGLIEKPIWPGFFLELWFSFLTGVLVCWGGQTSGARLCAALFCLVLLTAGWLKDAALTVTVAITGFAILGVLALGRMNDCLTWRWLQWLALISYSLYLLHNPVTGMTFRVVHKLVEPGLAADLIGLFATLSACLVVSYLAYRLIERPCIAWSRRVVLEKCAGSDEKTGVIA